MTVKSNKFKSGTDQTTPTSRVKPTDLNDTNDAILDFAGVGIAENALRTLQSNNVFVNGENFVVDEFTDATGTNNTVNTGSSTAFYDDGNDEYVLGLDVDIALGDTDHTDGTWSNISNAFDSDDNTYASNTSVLPDPAIGKTFTSQFIHYCRCKIDMRDSNNVTVTATIQSFNGSVWSNVPNGVIGSADVPADGTTFDKTIIIDDTIQGLRVRVTNLGNVGEEVRVFSFEYGGALSPSTLVIDANTKTLDGTEDSIVIFADKTLPTDTGITADITDGTTTLLTQPLDTVIGLDGFGSGTLEVTFNVTTADSVVIPTLSGYSVYIK